MADVEIRGLQAGFGGSTVLNGVDFTVPSGSIAAVLGPSGCGKTTLLRSIAGFHRPTEGEVRIDGRVVESPREHIPPERRGVGLVPQEGALFPHLSVAGNIGFGLGSKRKAKQRVEQMLEMVGLQGFADRMPQELSGGQQQRIALARALAPNPQMILLDEPFSSLDAGLRTELREDVARVIRLAGATALVVTHDQAEAMSMADIVAVMQGGDISQTGTPREVYAEPATLDIALLLGEVIVLEAPQQDQVKILRPEQLRVRPNQPGERPNAVVTDTHFYGHDAALLLEPLDDSLGRVLSDAGRLRTRTHGATELARGSEVQVEIEGSARLVGGAAVAEWRSRNQGSGSGRHNVQEAHAQQGETSTPDHHGDEHPQGDRMAVGAEGDHQRGGELAGQSNGAQQRHTRHTELVE